MSFILPKRGAVSVKFKVTGLGQVDSGQELYQVRGNLPFCGAPTGFTYGKIRGKSSSPQSLFSLRPLDGSDLEIQFRTDPIDFEKVLELIQWFHDIDDTSLKEDFCIEVIPYRRAIN